MCHKISHQTLIQDAPSSDEFWRPDQTLPAVDNVIKLFYTLNFKHILRSLRTNFEKHEFTEELEYNWQVEIVKTDSRSNFC